MSQVAKILSLFPFRRICYTCFLSISGFNMLKLIQQRGYTIQCICFLCSVMCFPFFQYKMVKTKWKKSLNLEKFRPKKLKTSNFL